MDMIALLALAKHGCAVGIQELSSSMLANDLSVSQQTASRRIKELLDEGYIVREVLPRGQRVKLTTKGINALRQIHFDLDKIFEDITPAVYTITGQVTSGLGEGRYYMEIPKYKEGFSKCLGFTPYPGTLNLRLITREDVKMRQMLQDLEGLEIEGFTYQNRTFGSVKCFKATIGDVEGAVVIPSRTHHGFNTLEAIAPTKIREEIGLRDGDLVTVKIIP
jgi:riboflavin kinase